MWSQRIIQIPYAKITAFKTRPMALKINPMIPNFLAFLPPFATAIILKARAIAAGITPIPVPKQQKQEIPPNIREAIASPLCRFISVSCHMGQNRLLPVPDAAATNYS